MSLLLTRFGGEFKQIWRWMPRRHFASGSALRSPPRWKDLNNGFPDRYESHLVEQGWMNVWNDIIYNKKTNITTDKHNKDENNNNNKDIRRFKLVLPPPNVTGDLHIGHALTVVIQDLLIRLHRMRGCEVSWIPGADHAGIATQVIMEKRLMSQQKLSRHDLGRDAFVQETYDFKQKRMDVIKKQLNAMGALLDWSNFFFTLDEKHSAVVGRAFNELYSKGLLYRQKSFVHWSCGLSSVISDAEVDHVSVESPTEIDVPHEKQKLIIGVIYDIAYRIYDSKEELVVSTTRPETLLGDVAVAVHPDDSRHNHLIGKSLVHPFRNENEEDYLIPVISDRSVDIKKGSGAVKITPQHDQLDFQIARRSDRIRDESKWRCVISDQGKIVSSHPHLNGLTRFEGRRLILNLLSDLNLYRGKHDHPTSVPLCSRSKDIIEPRLKEQWFIDCKPLIEQIKKIVENGKISFDPPFHQKIFMNFLENTNEWCVSRQIWWGHRIPAFRCGDNNDWIVANSIEEARKSINDPNIKLEQDEDVLDTWFSSALIPLALGNWPDELDEKRFPLSLMETGHDILFFWVARMIMMTLALSQELPFNKVLLHGVICDRHRRKMSKSLGNVVDPLHVINGVSLQALESEVKTSLAEGKITESELKTALDGLRKDFGQGIPQCGADALRYTLTNCDIKGHQVSLDVDLFKSSSAFCNKLWQASKFLLHNLELVSSYSNENHFLNWDEELKPSCIEDRWILSRLNSTIEQVNQDLDNNDLHLVTRSLRTFLYNNLCDIYIELLKRRVSDKDESAIGGLAVMRHCLLTGLTLLHPIMPFVTEELFQRIKHNTEDYGVNESILQQPYPTQNSNYLDENLERNFEALMHLVTNLRSLRKTFELNRQNKPDLKLQSSDASQAKSSLLTFLRENEDAQKIIQSLAQINGIFCNDEVAITADDFVLNDFGGENLRIALDVGKMIDLDSLLGKIDKRVDKSEKQVEKIRKNLEKEASKEDKDDLAITKEELKLKEMENKRDNVVREKEFLKRLSSIKKNSV